MRRISFLFLIIIAFAMNISAQTPAERLIQRMGKLVQKGYMYGHQDDPFYGITWEWDFGRSDTYDLVGDYPGVMGFDLGGIEKGDACNLDSVPFEQIRLQAILQHERGGIVTFSWHPRNPYLGTTAWIEKDIEGYNAALPYLQRVGICAETLPNPKHTVKSVLAGGERHELFQLWLARVADFLCTLKDGNGNPIPFIFRPWHENNGGWFWWGESNCTIEEFHALWNITQDYLNSRLYNNVVWSYSPNLQGNWAAEHYAERYPGNDRVDLIGVDAYQWGTEADFITGLTSDLEFASAFAKANGKLLAMTECGYQNSPDETWWTRVFRPIIEKYPICYFLPWRNFKKEHFGASKDAKTADDFKAWSKEKNFLFVNDIKKTK